jgi:toxin ParE1/3/4
MNVRWQPVAVDDLDGIYLHISSHSSAAAAAVVERILDAVDRLEADPRTGRMGDVPGTRELAVPGLPYIIVYSYEAEAVTVVAVFHGAHLRR